MVAALPHSDSPLQAASGPAVSSPSSSPIGLARALLPQEPRILNRAAEHELTQRHLAPALAQIEALFLALREGEDERLRKLQPVKLGKPYPIGQCLEITLAVQDTLRRLRHYRLEGAAAEGRDALRRFLGAGGTLRQVWGDLRDRYFQNAFLVGTLYVDVSNDTVTPTKPKVEILPFEESGLVPITDYRHFARIAERYWHARLYPNHLLPELAPLIPGIRLTPGGQVQLCDPTEYMLALTQANAFAPSIDLLSQPPMPAELFAVLARRLREFGHETPDTAAEGRRAALQYCGMYRARRTHLHPHQRKALMPTALRINMQLARLGAIAPPLVVPRPAPAAAANEATEASRAVEASEATEAAEATEVAAAVPRVAETPAEAPAASYAEPSAMQQTDARSEPAAKPQTRLPAKPTVEPTDEPIAKPPAKPRVVSAPAVTTRNRPAAPGTSLIPLEAAELPRAVMAAPFALMEQGERLVPVAVANAGQAERLPEAARTRKRGECSGDTAAVCEALRAHGVLQEWQPAGVPVNKSRKLYRVNEKALNALDTESAMTLRGTGALAMAYMQCISTLQAR